MARRSILGRPISHCRFGYVPWRRSGLLGRPGSSAPPLSGDRHPLRRSCGGWAGSCNFQRSDARTTGAPIFFMLAELTMARQSCPASSTSSVCVQPEMQTFAGRSIPGSTMPRIDWRDCPRVQRLDRPGVRRALLARRAGHPVRPIVRPTRDARQSDGLFVPNLSSDRLHDRRRRTREVSGDRRSHSVPPRRRSPARCGGQAIVPDCATIPEGIHRRNCVLARNG